MGYPWQATAASLPQVRTRTMLDNDQPFRPIASNDNLKVNPVGSADF